MKKAVNLGIDLGTTNSAICYFDKGDIRLFKDPISWKDTMSSVVSFKKERIIVGHKSKEQVDKNSKNTIGFFKRKMGTNETYKVPALSKSVSPVELSAYVLKELKTFVQGEDLPMDAAVITIPASFDTMQSNATKKAGEQAGFKDIFLLQEPIAASLAYANSKNRDLEGKTWLIYDFGGGTFDAALLSIKSGEMKVVDHAGDNYLGGSDLDQLIVSEFIFPYLESEFCMQDVKEKFTSAKGAFNPIYLRLLMEAEKAKIELSSKDSAEIEFEFEDENQNDIEVLVTIQRKNFEKIIADKIEKTIELTNKMLTKNGMRANDIKFALMVGGSTYIPYVRESVAKGIGVEVNTEIDPTTAVAIGAAYYAGTKVVDDNQDIRQIASSSLKLKSAYEKSTQDSSEYFACKVEGLEQDAFYKIVRTDSGFDSGLKTIEGNRISEDLSLVTDSYNFFELFIYDEFNNLLHKEVIEISQGKYNISGQPVPEDISIEVDDPSDPRKTKLEAIFKKNSILPLKKFFTKDFNKTIKRGSDELIIISIYQGDSESIPSANKPLGVIKISGQELSRDVVRGSDLEITLELSESQDLTISAYISMTDQEFTEVFTPKVRSVDFGDLSRDVDDLSLKLQQSIEFSDESNNADRVSNLLSLQDKLSTVQNELTEASEDDTTDKRYQLEDTKRNIAQEYYSSIKDEKIEKARSEYLEKKQNIQDKLSQFNDPIAQTAFSELCSREVAFLNSSSLLKVQELADEAHDLFVKIIHDHDPEFHKGMFFYCMSNQEEIFDQEKSDELIKLGHLAIAEEDFEELKSINREFISLLPSGREEEVSSRIGFY